jgi:hypothetical protein
MMMILLLDRFLRCLDAAVLMLLLCQYRPWLEGGIAPTVMMTAMVTATVHQTIRLLQMVKLIVKQQK